MKSFLCALVAILFLPAPTWATWSIVAIDANTGRVVISSATNTLPTQDANPVRTMRMRFDTWKSLREAPTP